MSTITSIDAIPVRIPLAKPMYLASEVIEHADNLIVRVRDSDGAVGWGEAASAPTMTGENLPGMVTAVTSQIAPALVGWNVEDRMGWMKALSAMVGNPAARSAVEVGLHDLLGRRRGDPIWALLQGDGIRAAPIIRTLSTDIAPDELALLLRAGATHFKVKTGVSDPLAEARALRALRETLGPDAHLSADANMAWTLDQASIFLERVAPAGLNYLEQPLSKRDISGMATLAQRTKTPLCLDEALLGADTILKYHQAGAAHGAGLKLLKLGGFGGAIRAEAAAQRCGWRTTWASKIAETSIGCAATLHAASVSENLGWGVSLTQDRLVGDLVTVPLNTGGGSVYPPQGPGLGVDVDPEQLRRFRSDQ